MGVVLTLPGEGLPFGGLLDPPWRGVTIWRTFTEVEFGLRQLPEEGALKWNFQPNISRWMTGGWGEAPQLNNPVSLYKEVLGC